MAGHDTAIPKSGDGRAELIRITRAARTSAVKARTAAMNQLKAILVTAPPALRDSLNGLGPKTLIRRCANLRPAGESATAGVKRTVRSLARRWQLLDHLNANHANTKHVLRLLKRYLARRLYPHVLTATTQIATTTAACHL